MAPSASHASGPVLSSPAAAREQSEPGLGWGALSSLLFKHGSSLPTKSLVPPFQLHFYLSQFSFAFGKQKPERLVSPFFPPPYLTPLGQRSTEAPGAEEPGEEKVNV